MKPLAVLAPLIGCAAAATTLPMLSGLIPGSGGGSAGTPISTVTTVHLSRQNYKIVKANAVGSSEGFNFLGFIPFKTAGYGKLYQNAGIAEGKALALTNVMHESTSPYFILFSLPKDTVRADIVEFTDSK
ncbi:MAG: DUF6567 family protein [Methylobacter sp.]